MRVYPAPMPAFEAPYERSARAVSRSGMCRGIWPVAFALAVVWTIGPASAQASDTELCGKSLSAPDQGIPACTRLIGKPVDKSKVPNYLSDRGAGRFARGDYLGAIVDFSQALDLNPRFTDVYNNRGTTYLQLSEFEKAINDFTLSLRMEPKSPAVLNQRGVALRKRGEYGAAIDDFNRAIEITKDFAPAYLNRGVAMQYRRQIDAAIADFSTYVRLKPKDAMGYTSLGLARDEKADFDGAIRAHSQAIALDPKSWEAYAQRGESRRLKGDLDGALADTNKAVELDANSLSLVNRARVQVSRGDLASAESDCNQALRLDSRNMLAYMNRGKIRLDAGDLRAAIADLDKAIELDGTHPAALTFRGNALRQAGRLDEALADFDRALRNQLDFVAGYTGRGQTYELKGDFVKARADYEKALSLPREFDFALANPAQTLATQQLAKINQRETEVAARAATEKVAAGEAATSAPIPVPLAGPAGPPLRRVALVIGNGAYKSVAGLPNPARDADAVAKMFQTAGFDSVHEEVDLTAAAMRKVLRDFSDVAATADVAVVFFAGHAIEVSGQNYLLPIDATLDRDTDVQDEAINLERVLELTKSAKRLKAVILDACRNNPFASRMKMTIASRAVDRGLARPAPVGDTLIAFAAAAGSTASDGQERNSPFTAALLRRLTQPGVDVRIAFGLVRDDVREATRNNQEPALYTSMGGGILSFGPQRR